MSEKNQSDHANIIMRPVFIYAIAILSAWAINYLVPLSWAFFEYRYNSGLVFFILGLFVFLISMGPFFKRKQNPDPLAPTAEIYQDGLYAFSRNPMYVSFNLITISLSLLLDNFWILILLLPTLIIMTYGVILHEEAYLEDKFGEEYKNYKKKVRRWL